MSNINIMASQTSEIDGKYIAGQMQSVRDRTVSTRTHNTWSIFSSCIIIVGGQNNRQRCVEDSGEVESLKTTACSMKRDVYSSERNSYGFVSRLVSPFLP